MRRSICLILPIFAVTVLSVLFVPAGQEANNSMAAFIPAFVIYLGRFHAIAVHFPTAFTFGALLTETLFYFTGRQVLSYVTRLMMLFALIGAIAAIPLGFAAATEYGSDRIVNCHALAGIAYFLAILAAAVMKKMAERKHGGQLSITWGYRLLLVLATVLVSWTGYIGGDLVHGARHLSWPPR